MPTETTMKYHVTPTQRAILKKTDNNKCSFGGKVKKFEPSNMAGVNVQWRSHFVKEHWWFLKMSNRELSHDSEILC